MKIALFDKSVQKIKSLIPIFEILLNKEWGIHSLKLQIKIKNEMVRGNIYKRKVSLLSKKFFTVFITCKLYECILETKEC